MNQSETVQAAPRLLAELAEAAQSAFITSESCGATAEYRHVFKFRTLAELQEFGRAWVAVTSSQPAPDLREAVAEMREIFGRHGESDEEQGDGTSQPAPAAASEDAERAAYLARWKDAPEWADWLAQDHDRECGWSTEQPSRYEGRWLCTVPDKESFGESLAPPNLLGSFGCEPRPQPVEDPERAAYLARWKYQPVWVNFLSQDADGQCKGWNRKPELQGGTWISVSSEGMWGFVDSLRGALGSVRCEPRPTPAGGQGVGP